MTKGNGESTRNAREGENAHGKVIICPTPIGNLGDMTQRAIDALREADTVCAEDTRVTGNLLAALGISKRLERLDENVIAARAEQIAQRAGAGEIIAYCSDAGMPGVSDPGMRLVQACRARGVPVEVLPGPSAVLTAYVASGCTNPHFYFGGFFPRKQGERKMLLEGLRVLDAALIFYESPQRLLGALSTIAGAFPLRELAVCRELTKLHEEVARGSAAQLRERFAAREGAIKGEIVLVIDGPNKAESRAQRADTLQEASTRAAELSAQDMRSKEIARALVQEFGIARNVAYDCAMAVRSDA